MVSRKINDNNTFYNIDFTDFRASSIEAVKSTIEKFWEAEVSVCLEGLSDYKNAREEYFNRNVDFFSSQIRVEHHKPVTIRLNEEFIANFLEDTLNSKTPSFKLANLTELEVRIINSFCEFLYKNISEFLIPPKKAKLGPKSEEVYNFTYLVGLKNERSAKIIITIPKDRLEFKELSKKVSFRDEDFINCAATVKIRAGYSKLTLEDLQNLTKDDIILLEDSSSSYLTLVSGNVEKRFRVEVNDSMILDIANDNDEETQEDNNKINNEVTMEKNLWDDIQIELSAEFSKVKMTIGELKQITKGQIVDLGSVFDNEISLYVEDKKVAKGELLIINDKYAVRLNEVLSSNVEETAPQGNPQAAPKAQPKAQAQPQGAKVIVENEQAPPQPQNPQAAQAQVLPNQAGEDEEFDYSDFEN